MPTSYFCKQLRDLIATRDRLPHAIDAEPQGTERYYHLLGSFTHLKAQIVLDACKRFNPTVLDPDEHVASKMLTEKARIGL